VIPMSVPYGARTRGGSSRQKQYAGVYQRDNSSIKSISRRPEWRSRSSTPVRSAGRVCSCTRFPAQFQRNRRGASEVNRRMLDFLVSVDGKVSEVNTSSPCKQERNRSSPANSRGAVHARMSALQRDLHLRDVFLFVIPSGSRPIRSCRADVVNVLFGSREVRFQCDLD